MHPLALSRRRLLCAATIGAGLTLFPALPAAAAPPRTRPAFRLPAPTGPHPIGTLPLHLIDPSRTDPWVRPARPRKLMVQLWYPTTYPAGPPPPWLTPADAGNAASGNTGRGNTPGRGAFADHLRRWRRELRIPAARHLSFHDSVLMVPALAALPGAQAAGAYGTIAGPRVAAVAGAHVGASFDLHLRGDGATLLDTASPRYPALRLVA